MKGNYLKFKLKSREFSNIERPYGGARSMGVGKSISIYNEETWPKTGEIQDIQSHQFTAMAALLKKGTQLPNPHNDLFIKFSTTIEIADNDTRPLSKIFLDNVLIKCPLSKMAARK